MPKTVLITGASSGFGRDAAIFFRENGWNVAATMRSPENAEQWARPRGIQTIKLDVTNEEQVQQAVTETIEHFGAIDVLVNNAGYGLFGPLEGTTPEQFRLQMDTNVIGLAAVTRAVLPYMRRQQSGVIINLSSVAGRVSFPYISAYHASKWAVEGLSESLQYELRPFNISVKLIEPGAVKTDFVTRSLAWAEHPAYTNPVNFMRTMTEKSVSNSPTPQKTVETIYRAATDGRRKLRYPVHAAPMIAAYKLTPACLWYGAIGLLVTYANRPPKTSKQTTEQASAQ